MAGLGFGEMAPSPEENKKEKVYFGVSGVEDIAVEAFSRAAERTAETAVVPEASVEKLVSENKERTELTAERSERPETYTHRLNEKGKAYPESEAHLEKEAAALRPDLEKMPETEREKIGVALRNLGFYAEEKKNLFFAGVFNKLAAVDKDKRGGVITKFVEKLENQFEKDAEKARERIETVEKTKNRETLANAGYLFGNLMKYGRTIADVAGWTVAAPLRYVMMAGMAFARGAEAMKEVRFENEKVVEKTRIEDADKAAGEGFKIYEAAKVRAGARKVSARDLDKAYREYLPHDLLERLYCKTPEQPSLVNRVVQGILRTHIEISVGLLGSKIEGIEENKKLSPEEKKIKRERLFHRFERRLRDYDRVVGQFGTVDVCGMPKSPAKRLSAWPPLKRYFFLSTACLEEKS
ncbi:MAG: hypothetical protein HYU81_00270 [Candidatus Brennerbacteria bacterium]|nr:hypothetical protein [Candidatus Brennerbacteria bacterium]